MSETRTCFDLPRASREWRWVQNFLNAQRPHSALLPKRVGDEGDDRIAFFKEELLSSAVIAAVEEGGLSFILFAVMLVVIFLLHRLTIPR